MRELKFDGLSPDGATLVLVGKDGQKWSLAIDERIEAAVRRDRARIGQVEIEQAGVLRPREIQARIRSGATAEDVAAASGLPLEHIRRFEGPVLTERAWVAEQAQATELRRPGGDIALGDLVVERLESEGVDPADIVWDAWRRDDGTWVVIATFPISPNTHVATWTYDSGSRTMTVVDENARSLSAVDPQAPLHLAASRPTLSTVAPLADDDDDLEPSPAIVTSVPAWARGTTQDSDDAVDDDDAEDQDAVGDVVDEGDDVDEDDPAGVDVVVDEQVEDVQPSAADDPDDESFTADESQVGDAEADSAEPAGSDDSGLFPTPNSVHRAGRKPSVPSFDDILFGPGPGTPKS
jgi:hypothetical protein